MVPQHVQYSSLCILRPAEQQLEGLLRGAQPRLPLAGEGRGGGRSHVEKDAGPVQLQVQ